MNLRQAAEMALECLDYHWDNPDSDLEDTPYVLEAKQALREALAQPDHIRDATEKVKWVGLSDEEKQWFKDLGLAGVEFIEAKLREKNS